MKTKQHLCKRVITAYKQTELTEQTPQTDRQKDGRTDRQASEQAGRHLVFGF